MQDDAPMIGAGTRSRRPLRFSLLALLIFITVVSIALAWLVQKQRVTATALFHVRSTEPRLLGEKSASQSGEADFEILKKTQLALLKSEFVLQSALRNPAIAGLALFPPKTDQLAWLQKHLQCEFIENGEILAIKLRGTEAQANDLIAVVDAVVAAYEKEALANEKARQLNERDLLERSLQNLTSEIKRKLEDYYDIAKGMGMSGGESEQVEQQLNIKRLDRVDEELAQLERDHLRNEIGGDTKETKFIQQRTAQLQKRQKELETVIKTRASVDLTSRTNELDRLQRFANEMAMKLEAIDVDISVPARIHQIQPAVITHGN
jgi:hypothetical protein